MRGREGDHQKYKIMLSSKSQKSTVSRNIINFKSYRVKTKKRGT